jgi:hypothetical protein
MSLRTLCKVVFTMLALVAVAECHAQDPRFTGGWKGTFQGIVISYIMDANSNYSVQMVSGTLQTMQSGKYHLTPQNDIIFEVLDWAPKTQPIYHPTGTVGGYYTQQLLAKPSGGSFSFVFTSPNSVTLTDLMTHGSLVLNRTQ